MDMLHLTSRRWFAVAALAILLGLAMPAAAALTQVGTVSVASADLGRGLIQYTISWTSTAGGAVSGNRIPIASGRLLEIKIVPGSAGDQPTDLYDITFTDEQNIDLLDGRGANLSNTTGKRFQWLPAVVHDPADDLDLVVSNAGNAKKGTVTLWVQQ